MTTTIATNKTKAAVLFAGLYLASLAILFVLFFTVIKNTPSQVMARNVSAASSHQLADAASVLQLRWQGVQDTWANAGDKPLQNSAAEVSFQSTIDSLQKATEALPANDEKAAVEKLIAGFSASFQKTKAVVYKYATLKRDTAVARNNTGEMDNLKAMLVDKEQQLAALQQRLQEQATEKDRTIATLQAQVQNGATGRDKNTAAIQAQMQAGLSAKDKKITDLQNSMAALTAQQNKVVAQLQNTLSARDKQLAATQASMQAAVADRDKRLQALQNNGQSTSVEKDRRIVTLQTSVADKDRTIAALQNQIKTLGSKATVAVPTSGSDAEWRQKHAQLKASYDNLAAKNNALTRSYQSLAQDNKRLSSQLQIRRATAKG